MRRKDLETLFGFSYWMKDRVLECAAKLTRAEFQAPSGVTTRDLRAIRGGVVSYIFQDPAASLARIRREIAALGAVNLAALEALAVRYPTAQVALVAVVASLVILKVVDLAALARDIRRRVPVRQCIERRAHDGAVGIEIDHRTAASPRTTRASPLPIA